MVSRADQDWIGTVTNSKILTDQNVSTKTESNNNVVLIVPACFAAAAVVVIITIGSITTYVCKQRNVHINRVYYSSEVNDPVYETVADANEATSKNNIDTDIGEQPTMSCNAAYKTPMVQPVTALEIEITKNSAYVPFSKEVPQQHISF